MATLHLSLPTEDAKSLVGNAGKVLAVKADESGIEFVAQVGGEAFPVGAVYLNISGVNPATELGYGTWSQIAQGQFLVGQKATDTDFDVAEETGGDKIHTHADHAAHTHVAGTLAGDTVTGSRKGGTSGAATLTDSHGHTISGATGNPSAALSHDSPSHLPPYFVVYAWKRTA